MVCALGGDGWGTASGREGQPGLVGLPSRTCLLVTKPRSVLKEKSAFTSKLVGGPHKPFLESPELHLSGNNLLCRAPTPLLPAIGAPGIPARCHEERAAARSGGSGTGLMQTALVSQGTALIPAPPVASPAWALPPAPAGWFLLKCPL